MSLDSRLRRAEASAGAVGVILAWLEAHAGAEPVLAAAIRELA